MIEYIDSIIRITGGADALIGAKIKNEAGELLTDIMSHLMLYHPQDELVATIHGAVAEDGVHEYLVPAELTEGVTEKWWYCVCVGDEPICFKQPFYIV